MLGVSGTVKKWNEENLNPIDPYFNNVSLLLTNNGVNGVGNSTFVDSASGFPNPSGITITTGGTTAPSQGTYNPFNSNYACFFNGTTDYLTIPSDTGFSFGTSDFTVEFWINPLSIKYSNIYFGTATDSLIIKTETDNRISVKKYGDVNNLLTSTNNIALSSWSHVAITRIGTKLSIFINGSTTLGGVLLNDNTNFTTTGLYIGRADTAEGYFNGYISNIRVIKGIGLYKSNFIPQNILTNNVLGAQLSSTSLLMLQNGTFTDSSFNPKLITTNGSPVLQIIQNTFPSYKQFDTNKNNSVYFDGNSYFVTDNSLNLDVDISNSDYTIETWFYKTGSSLNGSVLFHARDSSDIGGTRIWFDGSNSLIVDDGSTIQSPITTISNNKWYHLAVVRSGSTTNVYLNGIFAGNSSYVPVINNIFYVGNYLDDLSYSFIGYISNLRVIKGLAIYNSNFIPPNSPLSIYSNGGATPSILPSESQVELLVCQNNTIIDNSQNSFALGTVGNLKIAEGYNYDSYYLPVYNSNTSNSVFFNGINDGLSAVSTNLSADFTIEMWAYPLSQNANTLIKLDNNTAAGIHIWKNTSNQLVIDNGQTAQAPLSSNGLTLTLSSWNHIAVVRSGTTTSGYINGYLAGTNTFVPSINTITRIGYSSWYYYGYISNLRMVKGISLYNSNFTVPTYPITTNTNGGAYPSFVPTTNQTSLLACRSNAILDNSTNSFRLSTSNPNIKISTFNPYVQNATIQNTAPLKYTLYDSSYHNSLEFNGNSYVTADYIPDLHNWWTNSKYTLECWFYALSVTDFGGFPILIGNADPIGTTKYWLFGPVADRSVKFYYFNGSNITLTSNQKINLSAWNHLAFVKNNTGIRLYINGVADLSAAIVGTPQSNNTYNLNIGKYNNVFFPTNTYISNLHICADELYTSNFTPSLTGITQLSATNLLTFNDSSIVDSSTLALPISTIGCNVSNFNPFGTLLNDYNNGIYGGSVYFNGSNYLEMSDNDIFNFGLNPFSIEFFVNYSAVPNTSYQISQGTTGNFGLVFGIGGITAQKLSLFWYPTGSSGGGIQSVTWTTTPSTNTWYHVVACRSNSGGPISLFINGNRVDQNNSGTAFFNSTNVVRIGSHSDGAATQYTTGYMSNIRVLKGASAYNANSTTIKVPSSPVMYMAGTSLLLNFSNGGIIDLAKKNNLITYGNASANTSISKYETGSISFNGTTDYIRTVDINSYNFGISNFTIECWIYPTANPAQFSLITGNTSNSTNVFGAYELRMNSTGNILMYLGSTGNWDIANGVGTIKVSLNTWNHIALTRNGSKFTLWINGLPSATANSSNALKTMSSGLAIGADNSGNYKFTGYIDDLRITNGIVRYNSNFTPPTIQLPTNELPINGDPYFDKVSLLLKASGKNNSDNYSYIDNSPNNTLIVRSGTPPKVNISPFSHYGNGYGKHKNTGSIYFDTGANFLSASPNANFSFGLTDFTIEFFTYPLGYEINRGLLDTRTSTTPNNGVSIKQGPVSNCCLVSVVSDTLSASWETFKWNHIAIVRNTNVSTIYVNGVSAMSASTIGNCTGNALLIGDTIDLASYPKMYLSNLRIVKGTAVYTSNFIPPTSPLKPIANTSILLNFDNINVTDYAGKIVVNSRTPTTNPLKVNNVFKISKEGSLVLDGGTNFTFPAYLDELTFGSKDFTIESWVYPTSYNANNGNTIYRSSATGTNTFTNGDVYLSIDVIGSRRFNFQYAVDFASSTWRSISGSTTVNINTWYHVAVSRNSGNTRLFVNGNMEGSPILNDTTPLSAVNPIIGYDLARSGGFNKFNGGYISDFRVTKGVGRYTSNFIPQRSWPTKLGKELVSSKQYDIYNINYLIVGGGGGSSGGYVNVNPIGSPATGGAGGGGIEQGYFNTESNANIRVIIGAGGNGYGYAGNPSSIFHTKFSKSAMGGGTSSAGGTQSSSNGGCGGGQDDALTNPIGLEIFGQGYNGGNGGFAGCGGGGGSGSAGLSAGVSLLNLPGIGGTGITSDISCINTYYAGGGSGGKYNSTVNFIHGGFGGGGIGVIGVWQASYNSDVPNAFPGIQNSGGGAGGAGSKTANSGDIFHWIGNNGGSGIAVFAYNGPQRASGGFVHTNGIKTAHIFTTSGNLNFSNYTNEGTYLIQYIIIGGGGGGGSGNVTGSNFFINGGGGGAGGYITGFCLVKSGIGYTISIGAGGAVNDTIGTETTAFGRIAYGGGRGGNVSGSYAFAGGSGGGGCQLDSGGASPVGNGASGMSGQGFAGGNAVTPGAGAGGGGSAGAGGESTAGAGTTVNWSGSNVTYATGGTVAGGSGGAGEVNTGNGGKGGAFGNSATAGGSGIVLIRYLGAQIGTGGDTIVSANGYTVHTFNNSGTFTA